MASAAERMKAMGDDLQKRTEESYRRKDEFGPHFTYFRKDLEDVSFWKPTEKVWMFDIIPSFSGPNWPMDNHGIKLPEGSPVYVLDIQVHQNVGINDAQFICLNRNLGLPCPICEHQAELKKQVDYDADLIKGLYPKRRNVYNVVVLDGGEEEKKGVQVFEIAHFYMESKLTPLAMDARTKALISYSHYERGKTIQFEAKKKKFEIEGRSITGMEYIGHKFLDRDYVISDDDLNDAYTLDELLYKPEYDEVYESYWGEVREKEETQQPSRRQRGVEKEQSTETPSKKRSPVVEKETVKEQVPSGRRRQPRNSASAQESKKEEPPFDEKCPLGGVIGTDIDKLEGCNTCEVYDSCATKLEEIKEKEFVSTGSEEVTVSTPARRVRRPG